MRGTPFFGMLVARVPENDALWSLVVLTDSVQVYTTISLLKSQKWTKAGFTDLVTFTCTIAEAYSQREHKFPGFISQT
jgi:hypothetical protein